MAKIDKKSRWWPSWLAWGCTITFIILALEGVIPESFLDKVFEAIGILFIDTFGEVGSWKFYLITTIAWLIAVGTLLGLGLIVIEFVWKVVLWAIERFKKGK